MSEAAFDPKANTKLIDAEQETFWREIRQAYEQVLVRQDQKITLETQGKRVAVMFRKPNDATVEKGMVYIAITEAPHTPPTLIAP